MRKERRLGLALSGGGFRASFFHIGVLARLAELDLLRPIEAISTVSGGSIVGALYYLHLKCLLESAPDNKISPQAYVDMVKIIEDQFLDGVQHNLRTRAYADFRKNWKMITSGGFSRSDRMAELYEEFFYDRMSPHPRVCLHELKIQPPDGPKNFYPRNDNRSRKAKVPMLIINATTLNSGRNWQFSAVDAGEHEPKSREERNRSDEYDKSVLFEAIRYDDTSLPEKYQRIPLSIAVAASACVPGIFPPLPLTGLYPNVIPKLVDGGVFDNQGISALLYEGCTDVIISDASGQMNDENKPGSGIFSVVPRANSILMDRIRDSGFTLLDHLREAGKLHTYINLHLKDEFVVDKLKPRQTKKKPEDLVPERLSYKINGQIQLLLSAVRTDLDSFTEVEGCSLMSSGYAMADRKILPSWQNAFGSNKKFAKDLKRQRRSFWQFEDIRSFMEASEPDADYMRQLTVSRERMFKAYRLRRGLISLGLLIGLIGLLGPAALVAALWYVISAFSLWNIVLALVLVSLATGIIAAGINARWIKYLWEEFVLRYVVTAAAALFGSLVAKLHLMWIEPKFLAYGKLSRLRQRSRG
ncbi:MAG: patatin-like phospholipase family protein [Bacteroidota bacterium]